MSVDDGSDIIFLHDNISYNGDRIARGITREVSREIELDLAYSSEKVSNLELLVMQVAERASDYETLTSSSEELSTESIARAFQFDILSGFLNSELKEIESFLSSLQLVIIDVHKKFTESDDNTEESSSNIEAKLHYAGESLRNSQEQVAYIRKQSENFERLLAFDVDLENGSKLMNSKWNLQSLEQQRHFLQSLEKSLAREMDLEKMLSESKNNENELKMKLYFAEQDAYYSEDLIETIMERVFAAENTVELLLGNSKEFMELQNSEYGSTASTAREWEKSNMGKAIVEPSAEEAGPVREGSSRQNTFYLENNNMENIITGLRENVIEIQSRAESAEARCAQLMKVNEELNVEVGLLRNNGTEKTDLERKLKESEKQLEHAKASVDANNKQKNMQYTTLKDMERLIEDLQGKVSNAENRAELVDAKLLNDTNFELNEELCFLRGRLESLEASLHQADMAKVAIAKDIGNRTTLIVELVKKLASERARIQLQMSTLTKKNKILTKKCLWPENDVVLNHEKAKNNNDHGSFNSYNETLAESVSTNFQVDESMASAALEMKQDPTVSAEDSLAALPNAELVRTIDATQLNCKYFFLAFIVSLLSVLAVFLFQLENS
ncbi:WPP domain-interacting tail-anchored protein 1 isoform X2 [Phalaenopsis equestris]|uniref:WPP domain-interacting tail-anchored protein 1 isoform X2 n=1 Tax=Phalaenopsis equestris TaxID=78828 RepID=UPI0009E2D73D|nr:WPP domain-interacting tail-anchored protein 1 isoform X2 [Phalaenopsis equestris]